jgi:hypothetical protein
MKAEPGSRANFVAIKIVDEAAKAASQLAEDVAGDKPSRSIFVIVFVVTLVSVMALWIAFLIWLAKRVIF